MKESQGYIEDKWEGIIYKTIELNNEKWRSCNI